MGFLDRLFGRRGRRGSRYRSGTDNAYLYNQQGGASSGGGSSSPEQQVIAQGQDLGQAAGDSATAAAESTGNSVADTVGGVDVSDSGGGDSGGGDSGGGGGD